VELEHWQYGKRWLLCTGLPELLFTENETNNARVFGGTNRSPYVKDAFHEYVIHGNKAAVNPKQMGTKMAAYYPLELGPGESVTLKLRLTDLEPLAGMETGAGLAGGFVSPGTQERTEGVPATNDFGAGFDGLFATRQKEADEFYASRISKELSDDAKMRPAEILVAEPSAEVRRAGALLRWLRHPCLLPWNRAWFIMKPGTRLRI